MALTRLLTAGPGGSGQAYAQVTIRATGTSGDRLDVNSDVLFFPYSPISSGVLDLGAATEYTLPIPTGARALFIQLPYGNNVDVGVSVSSGVRNWYINQNGLMLATLRASDTNVYLYASSAVNGIRYVFV